MKKLYYLSVTYFSQVDTCILHLLASKYDVTYAVIIPAKNSNYNEEELRHYCLKHKINFRPYPIKERLRDPRLILKSFRIGSDIRKAKPDIIYTVSLDTPYFVLIYPFLDRSRTVAGIHDVSFHSGYPHSGILKLCRHFLVKYFRNFLVYSSNQEKIFQNLYKGKKVFSIELPLSFDLVAQNVAWNKQKETTQFLFFGNIQDYKGLDILLKAVNELEAEEVDFRLVIAGRCEDWEASYAPLIKNKSRIESIIRFISNEEIRQLFLSSHYLVLPYKDATQSGPLVLAYTYNIPVIASNIEAFREIVKENITGYLFERNNIQDLSRKLAAAAAQTTRDYQDLLRAQKEYISERFSEAGMIQQYQAMFDILEETDKD